MLEIFCNEYNDSKIQEAVNFAEFKSREISDFYFHNFRHLFPVGKGFCEELKIDIHEELREQNYEFISSFEEKIRSLLGENLN